jgi:hypothetical protein
MLEEKAASCWVCGLFRVYMLAKSRKIGFGSLRGGWGCAADFVPLFGDVACGICLLLFMGQDHRRDRPLPWVILSAKQGAGA